MLGLLHEVPGLEHEDLDALALGIDEPVLADAVARVDRELLTAVARCGARREDLDHEVRSAEEPAFFDSVAMLVQDHDDVGLQHRVIGENDVERRREAAGRAASLAGYCASREPRCWLANWCHVFGTGFTNRSPVDELEQLVLAP